MAPLSTLIPEQHSLREFSVKLDSTEDQWHCAEGPTALLRGILTAYRRLTTAAAAKQRGGV
jgi:hypothetical protein